MGGGRGTRQHHAQSVFNRNQIEAPMSMEGWMGWLSDGILFKRWRRYYFHLEYPFLNFYHEELPEGSKERAAVKPKGKISMRGSCLLNSNLAGDKKHADHADTRFRVKGNGKEWVLEAESSIRKAAWTDAIRTHIEYANPAKSPNGVNYNCRVRGASIAPMTPRGVIDSLSGTQANDDEDTPMCLNISLKRLTLVNLKTGKTSWTRPYWQMRTMQRPPAQPAELYLDFHAYGGTTKLTFTNVTAQVVGACVAGIVGTHAEWKGIFPAEW